MDIDHAQVWTALQLTHCKTVQAFEEKAVVHADNDDQRLIYIPLFRAKDAKALIKAVREKPAVIVYTWQPALIRQRLQSEENVQVEPVPESLARRFGLRV